MQFKVTVPATTANIGPGFDVWGMALDLYNVFEVEIKPESDSLFQISFEYLSLASATLDQKKPSLSGGRENLIYKCYSYIFEKSAMSISPILIRAKINVPISRGLGSSSTAIVAGLMIGNHVLRYIHGFSYSMDELFQFACQIEGHPDNVAPALFGGLVVSVYNEKYKEYEYAKLPFAAPLKIAGVVPHISLSTELARSAVLQKLELKHLIFHQGRMAILTHLFGKSVWQKKDISLLESSLQDLVHQTQRSRFIPGMLETFEYWKNLGCYGAFLSGAGSTLLGFWNPEADVESLPLGAMLKRHQVDSEKVEFKPNQEGCFIETIKVK